MHINKRWYSIKDVAKIFKVSKDTIRHYEKVNLIKPKRTENNYRAYSNEELVKLSIIFYLKRLNMPLQYIDAFFNNKTVEKSVDIVKKNQEILYMELEKIQGYLRASNSYLNFLDEIDHSEISLDAVIIESKEERYLYKNENSFLDKFDLFVKLNNLCSESLINEELKHVLHIGEIVNYECKKLSYQGQFILSPCNRETKNKLNEDYYASYFFKASTIDLNQAIEIMIGEIRKKGYIIKPPFYVFYLINYYETYNNSEHVTEIQVKVENN